MSREEEVSEILAHHGVLGMKWGKHRTHATSKDIRSARRGLASTNRTFNKLEDRHGAAINAGHKADQLKLESQMKKMEADFKVDPRRAVAARTTRGEKAALLLLTGPVGAAVIVGASGVSRRIEYKQDKAKNN